MLHLYADDLNIYLLYKVNEIGSADDHKTATISFYDWKKSNTQPIIMDYFRLNNTMHLVSLPKLNIDWRLIVRGSL